MGAGRFLLVKSTVGRFRNFPGVSGGVPESSGRLWSGSKFEDWREGGEKRRGARQTTEEGRS
jgi:hypothetical protein